MRYYFHLASRHESIVDDSGFEVVDADAVHHQVAQAVQELRQGADHDEADWRDWQLDVVDETGRLFISILLDRPLA
jgi:hypothetical protein